MGWAGGIRVMASRRFSQPGGTRVMVAAGQVSDMASVVPFPLRTSDSKHRWLRQFMGWVDSFSRWYPHFSSKLLPTSQSFVILTYGNVPLLRVNDERMYYLCMCR